MWSSVRKRKEDECRGREFRDRPSPELHGDQIAEVFPAVVIPWQEPRREQPVCQLLLNAVIAAALQLEVGRFLISDDDDLHVGGCECP